MAKDSSPTASSSPSPSSSSGSAGAPQGGPGRTGEPFTLYAVNGRVYARNTKNKLIDLGRLSAQDDGTWSYLLDGDKTTGGGFKDADAALKHIAGAITFLFLDGQFTAVKDLGGGDRPDLQDAPQHDFTLDPLGRGERMVDARS